MLKHIIRALLVFISVLCITFIYKKFKTKPVQEDTAVATEDQEGSTTLPEDFRPFYNNFHSDSTYQIRHINFPLTGHASTGDSIVVLKDTLWQQDDWIMHKPFNDHGGTFERTFTNVGGIITEFITGNGGMFSMEKRYVQMSDGEWRLVYYRSMTMHG